MLADRYRHRVAPVDVERFPLPQRQSLFHVIASDKDTLSLIAGNFLAFTALKPAFRPTAKLDHLSRLIMDRGPFVEPKKGLRSQATQSAALSGQEIPQFSSAPAGYEEGPTVSRLFMT